MPVVKIILYGGDMFRKSWIFAFVVLLALFATQAPALAQVGTTTPTPTPQPGLTLYTLFPSRVVGIGDSITFQLQLGIWPDAQVAQLNVTQLPANWTATFRGSGQIIQSAYVRPDNESTVDLGLTQPTDLKAGTYNFTVEATTSNGFKADLPLTVIVKEKLPPKLSLSVDLPTLVGTPSTTFSYNATLKNEGDEDLTVNLVADAPSDFQVTFQLAGQDVTSIPINANATKSISIQAKPVGTVQAGKYPITVTAQGGGAQANLDLQAQVTGQEKLTITTSSGQLSGQAYIGKATPLKVEVQNNGSASARAIQLTSTAPTGWKVSFDPQQINEIPTGQQVEVTANVTPADNAVAGDYMVTIKAQPSGGTSQSTDFRITVLTSTLWGVAGIALIAIALGVVALAVVRFGRR
jgi:uncharacterized membrane protein